MNWHSKPTAGIVVWMDLRPGKGLQAGLPAPQPDECAEHKVCSKPSKRTICENAILAQVWLRPGVPRPFDLRSSKGVLNKLHFTLLYAAGQGLWHQSAATMSCSREHVNTEPRWLGWVQSTRPAAGTSSSTEAAHDSQGLTGGYSGSAPQAVPPLASLYFLYSRTHLKIFCVWLGVMKNPYTNYTSLPFPAES